MLTDAEIAAMRATLDASLPSTCVIMRSTAGTADGAGGYIGGSVSAAGTVACRVSPFPITANREAVTAGQLGAVDAWQITVPANTTISSADRITSGGDTFEIVSIAGARSWEISRRILAKKVT